MTLTLANAEARIGTILGTLTVGGVALNALTYEPGAEGAAFPFSTLYPPDLAWAGVDQADRMLGRRTWDVSWKARVFVQMLNAQQTQTQLKALLGDAIAAFDADPTLAGNAEECRIVAADCADYVVGDQVVAMLYELTIRAYLVT